mgnify:CR=1 FL=1
MGGRGGSSGLQSNNKAPEFEGSEKQVKWANDIVAKAKDSLDSALQELKEEYERAMKRGKNKSVIEYLKNELELEAILNKISKNVLSNLSRSWSAKDVIENRFDLGYGKSSPNIAHMQEMLGIFASDKGDTANVLGSYKEYSIEKLRKNSSQRKKFESELIEALKKRKTFRQ